MPITLDGIAVMRNGKIYTLEPYRDPWREKQMFRWRARCDGQHYGLFRTKKEFMWEMDNALRDDDMPEHKATSRGAEMGSTSFGERLLRQFLGGIAERAEH